MKQNKSGFTLIELLVVIAIIAILAAILFPVFAAAKEKGRQMKCLGNMKQLATGFRLYLDAYGRYPGAGNQPAWWVELIPASSPCRPGATVRCNPRKGALFAYVKNTQVYVCPSDKNEPKDHWGLSYSMNAILGVNGGPYLKESQVKRPSKCVLLVDEGAGSVYKDGKTYPLVDGYFGGIWGVDCPAECHVGGGNFAWCDSHVKWIPSQQFQDGVTLNYDPNK